ncbi:MAG: hypothetical protein ACI8QC_002648 [Planctomycetota bacterium]|jgi:hypothetical protein
MATSTATRPTECPNCGVKLPDIHLSLCAYCAMPIGLGAVAEDGVESPNAGRIERIGEHDKFQMAMDFQPPEDPATVHGSQLIYRGKLLVVAGLLLLALGSWTNLEGESLTRFINVWSVVGIVCFWLSVRVCVRGSKMAKAAVETELIRRPGIITDRRSETNLEGWSGSTTYYFTIEFEGGVVGEFSYAGRGSNADPYVSNLPGMAYTRGQRLLHFMHIRV